MSEAESHLKDLFFFSSFFYLLFSAFCRRISVFHRLRQDGLWTLVKRDAEMEASASSSHLV